MIETEERHGYSFSRARCEISQGVSRDLALVGINEHIRFTITIFRRDTSLSILNICQKFKCTVRGKSTVSSMVHQANLARKRKDRQKGAWAMNKADFSKVG